MSAKRLLYSFLWLFLAVIPGFGQTPAHVIINEFMASNNNTYPDQDGSYEDWIELYNPTADAIDLTGYYLTDNLSNLTKSRLVSGPYSLVVPAGGYLVIWPSGKHALYNNHVSWGLSADGESVALVAPDGTTVLDSFTFPAQRTDVSMGRRHEASNEWVWFPSPTPMESNSASTGYQGFLDAPSFSHTGGFYLSPFDLSLSAPAGVTVLYTLDGSEPAAGNIGGATYTYKQSYPRDPGSSPGVLLTDQMNTFTYTAPIHVQDRSGDANRFSLMSSTFDPSPDAYTPAGLIKKAVVVKAKAVREGYLESHSATHTYFGFQNHYTLPVFSLTTSGENLFGYDNGIYNAGTAFDNWRQENPSLSPNGITPANYHRSGSEWELPVSVELFLPVTNERAAASNAGFRGQGRYTRASPHKSLRLYFRNSDGSSSLNYPVFPGSGESGFSRIVLRNWGNDRNDQFGLFRDAAVQRIVRRLNVETQQSQPVVTFLNGEYWGIADAKTRFDTKYFERVYGIPEDDLELLERDAMINEGTSNAHYLAMRDFIRDNDMSVAANYAYIRTQMDVGNFSDYQLAEIYFGNADWPTNNVRYYRKRTAGYEPGAPLNHDGRWRWLFYDLDFTLGNHAAEKDVNSLKRAIEHTSPWASVILRKLLDNTEFREHFIVRYADLMNVIFNAEQTNESISYYEDMLRPEMSEYRARWPYSQALSWDWDTHIGLMKDYADHRQGYARTHLRAQFALGGEQSLHLTVVNGGDKAYVQVNTLHLAPGQPGIDEPVTDWTGLYYPDYPVMLTTHTQAGKRFVRWEGDVSSTDDTIRVTLTAAKHIRAVFEDRVSGGQDLLHYWHFNGVSDYRNNIAADFTRAGVTAGTVVYAGEDGTVRDGEAGNMDGTNTSGGSGLNLAEGAASGRALRPRNPSDSKELIFRLPSRSYRNLRLAYASHRTNNGAQTQRLFYTTDYQAGSSQGRVASAEWHELGGVIAVPVDFGLVAADLPPDVYGTDNFAVKIRFEGSNASLEEGNNRFDNFTFHGDYQSTLPVRLLGFEAGMEGSAAVLHWRTEDETAFRHFEVAHSIDGDLWNSIGEVAAKGKSGPASYHFTAILENGRNYYRLKMVDNDGSTSYSEIRTLYASIAEDLVLAPNPARQGRFKIILPPGMDDYSVAVFNLSGTEVYKRDGAQPAEVNLRHLGPGVYLLKLTESSGKVRMQRIVIN